MAHVGKLYPIHQSLRLYTPGATGVLGTDFVWRNFWPKQFEALFFGWDGSATWPDANVTCDLDLVAWSPGDYVLTFEGHVPNTSGYDLLVQFVWTMNGDGVNWSASCSFFKDGVLQTTHAATPSTFPAPRQWNVPSSTGGQQPGATLWPANPYVLRAKVWP